MTLTAADYAPNIFAASLMIAVAAVFVIAAAMRLGRIWMPMLLGGALWAAAIAVKVAWAVAFNSTVFAALLGGLGAPAGAWVFYVYVGLLTGVFEVMMVFALARYIGPLRSIDRNGAMGFGVGFGALEAALIGAAALANTLVAALAPDALPPEALAQLAPIDWTIAAAGGAERISAIVCHVFAAMALLYALRTGMLGWLWAAAAFKTALDAIAVWAGLGFGLDSAANVWIVEAMIAGLAVIAVFGTLRLWRDWPADGASHADALGA